jgi:hypothetical protein
LAEAYREAGRLSESIALFEATHTDLEAKVDPDHYATLDLRGGLAGAYETLAGPARPAHRRRRQAGSRLSRR